MIKDLLKDKKRLGILSILLIVIIIFGIIYLKSGFKELKKNDTENIFVDNVEDEQNIDEADNKSKKSNNKNTSTNNESSNSNSNSNSKGVTVQGKDKKIVVEIKGEVKNPNVYTLNENSIVKDLIEAAGGLTADADLNNVNRAEKLQDHELVYIANKNEKTNGAQSSSSNFNSTSTLSNGNDGANKKININTATLEQLKNIKGVGDAKAKSIIEYREQNGGFKNIEDIKNVTGIGEKMFEKIKEEIEV